MGLQSTVSLYPAIGMAGQQVAFGQADYVEQNYVSDGTAKAGQFAFVGSTSVNENGVAFPVASLTNSNATGVVGLVEKVGTGYVSPSDAGTMVYAVGELLTIAKNGEYYVVATGAASVGDHVLVNKSTGAMSYATPTAPIAALHSGTVTEGVVANLTVDLNSGVTVPSGSVDTGWVVKTAATASGDIIVIAAHANA